MVELANLARAGHRSSRIVLMVGALLLLAAIAVPALALHNPAPTTIEAGDFFFDPDKVTIEEGTNILLKHVGAEEPHTLSSIGAFESGALFPGGQRIVVTEHLAPGRYEFFCGFHPGSMTGTLIVEGA